MLRSVIFTDRKSPARIALATDHPLLPKQRDAVEYLKAAPRRFLFGKPGTGKTLIATNATRDLGIKRVVIVTPSIGLYNWLRHAPLMVPDAPVIVVRNCKKPLAELLAGQKSFVLIMTYGIVRRAIGISEIPDLDLVIGDETHEVKTPGIKTTKAFFALANSAKRSWMMTGTPVIRYYDDLFTTLHHVMLNKLVHKQLHTYKAFVNTFCKVKHIILSYNWKTLTTGNKNLPLLKELMFSGESPPVFFMKRSDVAELPQAVTRDVSYDVPRSPEYNIAVEEYDKAAMMLGVDDMRVKSKLAAVRRACGMDKALFVVSRVLEILSHHNYALGVVVFAYHLDVVTAIALGVEQAGMRVKAITGGVNNATRSEYEAQLNNGELDVLVCQIKAGGVALNLQERCANVVMAERDWSDALNEQAINRVVRLGQTREVEVDFVVSLNHEFDGITEEVNARKKDGASRLED